MLLSIVVVKTSVFQGKNPNSTIPLGLFHFGCVVVIALCNKKGIGKPNEMLTHLHIFNRLYLNINQVFELDLF